jgi:predicted transcriptional regulator of viral defense system
LKAATAYATLRKLGALVLQTADAAAALRESPSAATKTLTRLAGDGLVTRVRHGTWWIGATVDPFRLAPYLTIPYENYLSLQTALQLRGVIEQIPEVIYAVTIGRTQRIETDVAVFSFHHVAPEVFGGYEQDAAGVRLATSEKALFDSAYLSAGKSRLFASLPELQLPKGFRRRELWRWLAKVPSARSRTITERKLEALLGA